MSEALPPSLRVDREDFLSRALDGDPVAWGRLVEEHTALIFRVAYDVGLTRDDAEDVVQTVWLALLKRGRFIRDPIALPAWLVTTARRTALQARWAAKRPVEPLRDSMTDDTASVEDLLHQEQDLLQVRRALRSLQPNCRTLLWTLFQEAKPNYRDVSKRLGIPIGSIGPKRARCLKYLLRILEEEEQRRS